jgi:ABC-type antimicrobial peptide transport system permease subunit
LITSFAGVGLLLAMLGVYGTITYSVTQQRFEIGLRMAFGARHGVILLSVVRQAARLACYGIAAGLILSFVLTRLLTSMLVGVRPMDPMSLSGAASLILLTALCSAFAPGWKATHVDPIATLRAE